MTHEVLFTENRTSYECIAYFMFATDGIAE